ncbi:Uu.00g085150.m01.CDS01 [Anthostomella pinea]|uniref:Uu.00g085150.m01.CDS01 n=1 Tax=Anthostomella pinea TaxID=933095 RepID=A0AAI8VLW6_9PEZI|nr:Uu.00g085150.m01.CDS01 [Anthostomella pinea]
MVSLALFAMTLVAVPLQAATTAKRESNSSGPSGLLTFRADGSFQISVFEDLHFGENAWGSWGPQQDLNSVKVIDKILEAECPDLVVLNGDLITGENGFLENSTVYIDQIVQPLVDRNLTFASTYGNHDYDFNISGEAILAREHQSANSRTTQMVLDPNAGVSNYYIPVYDCECLSEDCVPELILWFFDSRGGFFFQQKDASGDRVGQPNWVDFSVVNWFLQTNDDLVKTHGKVIPSLAFVHIPTYASYAFQQAGVDSNKEPGINEDVPLVPQAQGWCPDGRDDDSCTYGGQDVPFMQAVSATAGLLALFSGHDHGDSWCLKWDKQLPGMEVAPQNNISLCFGQHTGYGGYGNWERGSRQIVVSKSERTGSKATGSRDKSSKDKIPTGKSSEGTGSKGSGAKALESDEPKPNLALEEDYLSPVEYIRTSDTAPVLGVPQIEFHTVRTLVIFGPPDEQQADEKFLILKRHFFKHVDWFLCVFDPMLDGQINIRLLAAKRQNPSPLSPTQILKHASHLSHLSVRYAPALDRSSTTKFNITTSSPSLPIIHHELHHGTYRGYVPRRTRRRQHHLHTEVSAANYTIPINSKYKGSDRMPIDELPECYRKCIDNNCCNMMLGGPGDVRQLTFHEFCHSKWSYVGNWMFDHLADCVSPKCKSCWPECRDGSDMWMKRVCGHPG